MGIDTTQAMGWLSQAWKWYINIIKSLGVNSPLADLIGAGFLFFVFYFYFTKDKK